MMMKCKWLSRTIVITMCLVHVGTALSVDPFATVTVGPNTNEGIGYKTFEGAKTLTLRIVPQGGYRIVTSGCTDNAGLSLWSRISASENAHLWRTSGVLPNFAATAESHAAKFHGTLALATTTAGGTTKPGTETQPSTPLIFDIQVSDIDIDVDALGRHADAIWTPASQSTGAGLNDLEDKCENSSSGGLAMPVTDRGVSLPATCKVNTGKALRLVINAKRAGSVSFSSIDDKLAVYRQSSDQQNKVTSINVTTAGLNEIFYLHTCTGFAAVNLKTVFTPKGATSTAEDTVRIYPATAGYQLFVNTADTTGNYVLVEALGRTAVTVTRNPSDDVVELRLRDNNTTNTIKFYEADTGGTGVANKEFTMAKGTASKTFWISGHADGTGERTIKLDEKNGTTWTEKKSLTAVVFKVAIWCSRGLTHLEHDGVPSNFRFELEFTPADVSSRASRYQWDYSHHTPYVNGPSFPYTTPTLHTTSLRDFHWYGHGDVADDKWKAPKRGEDNDSLRWMGNVMRHCSYKPWCETSMFNDIISVRALIVQPGLHGPYFYVDVDHSGATKPPEINIKGIQIGQDASEKWVIESIGTMTRTSAWIKELPNSNSQFYNKTLKHESTHVTDWEKKGDDGKFLYQNATVFFNDVNGKGWKENTDWQLRNKIIGRYNEWMKSSEGHPGPGESGLRWQELRAYEAEYTVEPVGANERSATWIKANYKND